MPKVEGVFLKYVCEKRPPPPIPETDVRMHAKETRECKPTKNKFLRETWACKSKQQRLPPYSDLCISSISRFVPQFFTLFHSFAVWDSLSLRKIRAKERTQASTHPNTSKAGWTPASFIFAAGVTQLERYQDLTELISHRKPVPRPKSVPSK